MIIQENDFLKTYNEMNKLWEDTEDTSTTTRKIFYFEPNPKSEEGFSIWEKAEHDSDMSNEIDVSYWCDLREVVSQKYMRMGGIEASTWYGRLLSFYRTFKVEESILRWLNSKSAIFGQCTFGGGNDNDHDLIQPDTGSAYPDFSTGVGDIECKALTAEASLHDAQLVIRHAPTKQKEIYFCIVGEGETLKRVFGEDLPEYVFNIDQDKGRTLKSKFDKFPVPKAAAPTVENEGYSKAKTLEQWLKVIDERLAKDKLACEKKAALILDTHTKQLNKTITSADADAEVPTLPSNSLKVAIDNLTASAEILKDAISNN
jgi:hypothetical protein